MEYMSFKNRWTITRTYDFQVHQHRSQGKCCVSQSAQLWFEVLPDLSPALPGLWSALPGLMSVLQGLSLALPGAPKVFSAAPRCSQTYHNHSPDTPVPVIRYSNYFEGQLECPPRVWYSPDIDPSKLTLHILSDTPGRSQWLKDILLMLLWQLLVLSETAISYLELSSWFVRYALLGLNVGRNQISSVYGLSWTYGSQYTGWAGACPVTECTAEQTLPFRLYPFELCWWTSVQIIFFKIWFFGSPNIQISQNVVRSAFEALWIEACSRKCGIHVSESCRSSAESLSRICLLRFTLSSCSSIQQHIWPNLL